MRAVLVKIADKVSFDPFQMGDDIGNTACFRVCCSLRQGVFDNVAYASFFEDQD